MTDPTEAIRKAHAALMDAHKRGASVVVRQDLVNAFRRSLDNASAWDFVSLFDRLDSAEAEVLEQARLNGMGAEREAALLARLDSAERDVKRLDYLQTRGATVDLVNTGRHDKDGHLILAFRIGGWNSTANTNIRDSIDAALRVGAVGGEG